MAQDLETYLTRILPRLRAREHPDFELPCQIWTGARRGYQEAYGAIWYDGKSRRVHRVVWRCLNGRWPRAELAHGCNRTLCCELSHLREATHSENMLDQSPDLEVDEVERAKYLGDVPF